MLPRLRGREGAMLSASYFVASKLTIKSFSHQTNSATNLSCHHAQRRISLSSNSATKLLLRDKRSALLLRIHLSSSKGPMFSELSPRPSSCKGWLMSDPTLGLEHAKRVTLVIDDREGSQGLENLFSISVPRPCTLRLAQIREADANHVEVGCRSTFSLT